MRSISVLKILQITMGLSGIFIVILGVGYLGSLKGGLTSLLIQDPLWAGMLTGLPLIPLIHSAKQKYRLSYYQEQGFATYSSTANTKTYEVPVAGWLSKVVTTVYQETLSDQDAGLLLSWTANQEVETWEQNATTVPILEEMMLRWKDDSHLSEFQTNFPVQAFFIENNVASTDQGAIRQEHKYGGPGKFFEQGQQAKLTYVIRNLGTASTSGNTHIISEAVFIVAAFDNRKRRPEETAPWVNIFIEGPDTTATGFHWSVNTNMRIANYRVTIWQGIDTDNQANFSVGKYAPNMVLTAGSIEMHNNTFLSIMHPIQDATGSGTTYAPVITAYARGPYYMKKGETLMHRYESIDSHIHIQFQYIPDYNYTSEFNRRFESTGYTSDYASQWIPLFTVPYDMYVTTVKGNVSIITDNDDADAVYSMQLMGMKSKDLLDTQDMLLNLNNADVHGNILGATNDAGQLPWSLATITMTIDAVDGTTNTTAASKVGYAEAIADFYPNGSQIGFWLPDDMSTNIGTFVIEMHIEALNRIKTRNVGTNMIESPMVVQHRGVS